MIYIQKNKENFMRECNTLTQKQNKNTNKGFLNKTIILYTCIYENFMRHDLRHRN